MINLFRFICQTTIIVLEMIFYHLRTNHTEFSLHIEPSANDYLDGMNICANRVLITVGQLPRDDQFEFGYISDSKASYT